ncbi:hypothetical protein EV130_102404 [Rhizobium azibense]|uniref:LysR substrate binding domain-containing protein n=1 Tax=Rhizobium azibense TaxID=1136135 RepID=A0A4R3R4Z3_9HYPH|nr:hypothetical protein EV130_102404 [Rhizobium azibense]
MAAPGVLSSFTIMSVSAGDLVLIVHPIAGEFVETGRDFNVAVDPAVTTNDMGVMVRMACAGAGVTFGMVQTFQSYFDRGESWCRCLRISVHRFRAFISIIPSAKGSR